MIIEERDSIENPSDIEFYDGGELAYGSGNGDGSGTSLGKGYGYGSGSGEGSGNIISGFRGKGTGYGCVNI